ncbi:redox-regulated ATPase YchF [Thermosyntropha sp.]|uniref:redox-regulated ATPase YchF n=1 Tax=Thermosyntropha sp. TaxID=2740820 RepID=UPI0025EE47C5|nr:redox-regulated ATPase YchF [Thermosyntropha sp.]MBO8158421.1 redox-regulated ATPase YchF [Thermosyntropha sp.]
MQLGIIGLSMAGKTTIFELLTETFDKQLNIGKTNTSMAKIPDNRVDFLSNLFKPKKTTYAQLEIVDIPGLIPGGDKSATVFLDAVRKADALLHVVRAYEDDIDPIKDIETVNYELLLADLDLIEKRIERINSNKKKNQMQKELMLLEKLKKALEEEKPLSSVEIDEEEKDIISNYQFLTTKPMLICLNVDESVLNGASYKDREKLKAYLHELGIPMLEVSAKIEQEISQLNDEEKEIFMQEMGLTEPGIVKIARSMYERLGLISFFTVGEDEVKAWTIEKGTTAKKAAGKIHSDIERGFIRAEVIDYEALHEFKSIATVKEKGLFRLEGKDYIVKDGDIIHFRFNV